MVPSALSFSSFLPPLDLLLSRSHPPYRSHPDSRLFSLCAHGLFSPFTLVNANAVSCFNFPSPHKTERRTCRLFCSLMVLLVLLAVHFFLLQIRYRYRSRVSAISHKRIVHLHMTHIIITDVHNIIVDHNHVECNRACG